MLRKLVAWAIIAALIALCPHDIAAKPQDSPCGLHVFGVFVSRVGPGADDVAHVALVLSAPQPELVSGTLRLYSGNERIGAAFEKAPVLTGATGIFFNVSPPRQLDGYDAILNVGGAACELPAMPFSPPGDDARRVLADDATATAYPASKEEKLPPLRCGAVEIPVTPKSNLSAQLPDSLNVHGTAKVLVYVAADGSVESSELTQSSGNTYFDNQALATARRAAYYPAMYRCMARASTYLFTLSLR